MNTDITPDFYNIDVGTIGVYNDLALFKKSCVQGEKFFAVDTFQLFVANTTAGASNATVTEFMPRQSGNTTATLSGTLTDAPDSWKFKNVHITISANTTVQFKIPTGTPGETNVWYPGDWCNIWIISNDGSNLTYKITYGTNTGYYTISNNRNKLCQYYDTVSINIDPNSGGTSTARLVGALRAT